MLLKKNHLFLIKLKSKVAVSYAVSKQGYFSVKIMYVNSGMLTNISIIK